MHKQFPSLDNSENKIQDSKSDYFNFISQVAYGIIIVVYILPKRYQKGNSSSESLTQTMHHGAVCDTSALGDKPTSESGRRFHQGQCLNRAHTVKRACDYLRAPVLRA
jgi:hypothetical protein